MFKIENKTIHITRGDRGTIKLKASSSFSVGDKIKFTVVEKKDFSKIVLEKKLTVTTAGTEFLITLTEQDTKIGEIINKPTTYWYEIEYNDDQTIIGYDEDGAKEFILYPEAKED